MVVYLLLPFLGGALSLSGWEAITQITHALKNPVVVSALRTSLISATLSTLICILFGVPLAYTLSRHRFRGAVIVEAIILSPLVVPPIVTGLFLLVIFGPNGIIGGAVSDLGLRLTRSLLGIMLAQIAVASPFIVITAKAAFDEIDPKLEFASRILGKGAIETFFRITLPLAKGGIIAGLALTFARAIGEFGATFMVAYHPRTIPIQLYVSFLGGGVPAAVPLAIILWIMSLGVIIFLKSFEIFLGGWVARTKRDM